VHYLQDLGCEVLVKRNDKLEVSEALPFDKILLSPGPGIPDEAGLLKEIIATYAESKSILGVCLGQQAIAEVFGGAIVNLDTVYHGVATTVTLTEVEDTLFVGLEKSFEVGRYHSWVVDKNLPETLLVTSYDSNGQIMSLKHRTLDVKGVQYHPESVLTPHGKTILKNWIDS